MGATWIVSIVTLLGALVTPVQIVSELHVCAPVPQSFVRCHAIVHADETGAPHASHNPAGLSPKELQSAYKLPASKPGQMVAIVDAFDNPSAERDLELYRSRFGLPACAGPCVRKINQRGGSALPAFNEGWSLEEALDLDAVTAVCPSCSLLLVEARSDSVNDLMAAEDQAYKQGATVISNSWGASEVRAQLSLDKHFNHKGVMITVSSGDSGYGVEWPASSPYVTAVGGTTLKRTSKNSRGWGERAWSGSGSGCSAYEKQPQWQSRNSTIRKVCKRRAVADVSAVADPNTGLAVYDSAGYQGQSGWFEVGGTSLSAPIIAGVYALAGNASSLNGASRAYANPKMLNPVTSGSNGVCGNALCKSGRGWGGPTGLGTPKGVGAF